MRSAAAIAGPLHLPARVAVLTAAAGLLVWYSSLGPRLERLSFDITTVLSASWGHPAPSNLVVIKMDEPSYQRFNQPFGAPWDRSLHAQLLNRLTADRAALVVFDAFLTEPGDPRTNQALARAIRSNGRTVLGAELQTTLQSGYARTDTFLPLPVFREAAAACGVVAVTRDRDDVVRRIQPGTEVNPSLPWAAAMLLGVPLPADDTGRFRPRWMRFDWPGSIPSISYFNALNQPTGFYAGRHVFIGGGPRTRFVGDETDEFTTPLTFDSEGVPGVELQATAFLNLLRGDWLARPSPAVELPALALLGLAFGFVLARSIPLRGLLLAGATFLTLLLLSFVLHHWFGLWWPWAIAAFVQIPAALLTTHGMRLLNSWRLAPNPAAQQGSAASRGRTGPQPQGTVTPPSAASPPSAECPGAPPTIPDHVLLKRIGRGGYGEVWLARNAVGLHHAVKIVYRDGFSSNVPFEREFAGIQKFMPISRGHPNLIHILHVGRNSEAGLFYCIMESGDDQATGQKFVPAAYEPRNLATELSRRGHLSVQATLALAIPLASALAYLHEHGLIHRDIKPSNIIFVNGAPKLADIGLVTEIASSRRGVSLLGTEGYIPPEGPGQPSGDVYGLGVSLYEAAVGRYPANLRALSDTSPPSTFQSQLEALLLKACAPDLADRFQSAATLHAALLSLQNRLDLAPEAPTRQDP